MGMSRSIFERPIFLKSDSTFRLQMSAPAGPADMVPMGPPVLPEPDDGDDVVGPVFGPHLPPGGIMPTAPAGYQYKPLPHHWR